MAKILEEIRARLTEAQKNLQEATQVLTAAQQKQQVAQHNFNIWNAAMQIELREEQLRETAMAEKQPELPLANVRTPAPALAASTTVVLNGVVVSPQNSDEQDGPNKTDIVRNLLSQHPAGMSAVDIWKAVKNEFHHRPYLYSVLKRLRDRNEISKRRNKYCLTAVPKAEEVKEHSIVH